MTYEDYESHKWQEGEELIIDDETKEALEIDDRDCVFVEHDEVYGSVVVRFKNPINKPTTSMFEPNMKIYSTSILIEGVEFKRNYSAVKPQKVSEATYPKV